MLFICLTIVRSYNWDLERTKNYLIRCKGNRDYIVLHFFILFKETTKGVVRSSNKPQIEHSPTVRTWSSKEDLIWLEENWNYIVSNFLNLYNNTTKHVVAIFRYFERRKSFFSTNGQTCSLQYRWTSTTSKTRIFQKTIFFHFPLTRYFFSRAFIEWNASFMLFHRLIVSIV